MDNSTEASALISLPKGGGAIKGIGETFQPNLFSGTGNFSVPIYTSPGRNGFSPQLTLQYSTGNGNGPFGVGWQLSIPRIMRKTEKGLPTYTGDDVFVMSGAEDLVPYRQQDNNGQWLPLERRRGEYLVSFYRPRTEGLFARIERWEWTGADSEDQKTGDIHWRAITQENVTSIYGRTQVARITDPDQAMHVYEWLLEETFDAKGNHIAYEYVQDGPHSESSDIHEHNRQGTQTYIRRIKYGNTPGTLEPTLRVGPIHTGIDVKNPLQTRQRHYLFEVLFDYGDLPGSLTMTTDLSRNEVSMWDMREDPFSNFRAGFDVRTLRRCQRVLMLHHFKEGEVEGAPLVKSTDFSYTVNPETQLSFLTAVTVSGYRRDLNDSSRYLKRDMPPVTFTYSAFKPREQRYQSVTGMGNDFPARSLAAPELTVMDLFGNGLPDILQETPGGFYFWENLGEGQLDRRRSQAGDQPALSLAQANVTIGDMGGDGLADLVVDAPPISGFYESTPDARWKPFQRFEVTPSFSLSDPNTRLVDLTGDGLSDVLVTRDSHFLWFRCLGEAGYADPQAIPRQTDLDIFPDVYFNDPAGRVRLADMSGDGLSDIVLVHDGRIDYWPNLGYGRFGRRITMTNTPRIGFGYDPRRMFLVDLDGTGCADLVYVDFDRVQFWFNQSGNGWSPGERILGTPPVSDLTAVQFTDFYGTGTATLMWSYDAGQLGGISNYKILDFCGGQKPHLLIEMNNNLGATTRVKYAPSTQFYLEDRANGRPWHSSLPFPVQVLEKTEVIDHVSQTKLVTTYKYHHGYYDGREREFRGFGRVDQFDTEVFEDFVGSSLHGEQAQFANQRKHLHVVPIETRTWFHTGILFDRDRNLDHRELTEKFRDEYYSGDSEAFALEDHQFEQPDGSLGLGDTPHEALRALRGAVLRTEVYGRDQSDLADHPYVVTENRYQVRTLQPQSDNNRAVYLMMPLESITSHYERNPKDPRVNHTITAAVDAFGTVTDSVAIAYPRRKSNLPNLPEQEKTLVTYTQTRVTHQPNYGDDEPNWYLIGVPVETQIFEITALNAFTDAQQLERFKVSDFYGVDENGDITGYCAAAIIDYEASPQAGTPQRRRIEWVKTRYRPDAEATTLSPVCLLDGEVESLALPCESLKLAFTTGVLEKLYGDKLEETDLNTQLIEEGKYLEEDGHWWIPTGKEAYDPEQFYLPVASQDPFGNIAQMKYDSYGLAVVAAQDPVGNVMKAAIDYRVLQPFLMRDPNWNYQEVAFDALGLLVGTAVMGKAGEQETETDNLEGLPADLDLEALRGRTQADSLGDGFQADLPDRNRQAHLNQPLGGLVDGLNIRPQDILRQATTRLVYDWDSVRESDAAQIQPLRVYTLAHEQHAAENSPDAKIQHQFLYSDGFGREVQTKVQAEPLPEERNRISSTSPSPTPRWVGTGWTFYNNKGKPVRQFEPFFADSHNFEPDKIVGVSSTLFYDPLERVVCTLNPNHTYEKVVFDAWEQSTWDVNDTVRLNPVTDPDVQALFQDWPNASGFITWYQRRTELNNDEEDPEYKAAQNTEAHAYTPTLTYLDTLGRVVLTVEDNGTFGTYETRVSLDIEGNEISITDPRNIEAFNHTFDIAGRKLNILSADAGPRCLLLAVDDQPLYTWDGHGNVTRTVYDSQRRPLELWVAEPPDPSEQPSRTEPQSFRLVQKNRYGESVPDAVAANLRGAIYQVRDEAGIVENTRYDFKGNLEQTTRRLLKDHRLKVDWSNSSEPELEASENTYKTETAFDALNRVTTSKAPDGSIYAFQYNEANLLDQVSVQMWNPESDQLDLAMVFVDQVDYNAKGQRIRILYGNEVETEYTYEDETFRLKTMTSKKPDGKLLQDLHYTYDPVGNITHIKDGVFQDVFNHNQKIEPVNRYQYDPLYRLTQASGREHELMGLCHYDKGEKKQTEFVQLTSQPIENGKALLNYKETFTYDKAGNITKIHHDGGDGRIWDRKQTYAPDSNRLKTSDAKCPGIDKFPYPYDVNGNITQMPHLSKLVWDYANRLISATNNGNGGAKKETFYSYDAGGNRVRKVTETGGQKSEERIYVGSFEVFRSFNGNNVTLERESLHVMDGQKRVALIETLTPGSDGTEPERIRIRYQLDNHLGSALVEVNEQADVISYEEYYPYGGTAYLAAKDFKEAKQKRYRYSGKERDDETGLYYYGARYYAPWLGRWISCDPLGSNSGINLYFFVGNNPIILRDLAGLIPSDDGQSNNLVDIIEYPNGSLAEKYEISPGGWISKTLKEKGYDQLYTKESGYGAYQENVVLDENGETFHDPDNTEPGENFYLPIAGNLLLVKDFDKFYDSDMEEAFKNGFDIKGADNPRLKEAMISLSKGLQGQELDSALAEIADIRGKDIVDIQREYTRFKELQKQAIDRAGKSDKLNSNDFWGTTQQLRFGKIVGDKLGIDPVFGSLLSPTGGQVGPGDSERILDAAIPISRILLPMLPPFAISSFKKKHLGIPDKNSFAGWHGAYHDAGGYLRKYHGIGPGYTYRKGFQGADSLSPLEGQINNILFWFFIRTKNIF